MTTIRFIGQFPKEDKHKQDYYVLKFGPGLEDIATIGVPIGSTEFIEWLKEKCEADVA